jgi:hypothetical protein
MSGLRHSKRKRELPTWLRIESPPPPVGEGVAIDRFTYLLEANTTADLLWDYLDFETHIFFACTHKRALFAGGLSVLSLDMDISSPVIEGIRLPLVWRTVTLPLTMRCGIPPGDKAVRFMASTGYAFKSLNVTGLTIDSTSPVCKAILKLKQLIVLNMDSCLSFENHYPDTRSFKRFFENVTNNSMSTLTTISVSCSSVNDQTLSLISQIRTLTDLNLHDTRVTDAGLHHLSSLHLTHLCLARTRITDAGVVHLKKLPLKHLNLSLTAVGYSGLLHLKDVQLMRLQLSKCANVLDLSPLTTMPLEHLNISGCINIPNHGFEPLLTLPLKYLNISGCDEIIPLMGKNLIQIRSLKYVDMSLCVNIPYSMSRRGRCKNGVNRGKPYVETRGKFIQSIPENCHLPDCD